MKITSDSVRVQTEKAHPDKSYAVLDITRCLYGYGAAIRVGAWAKGVYYLCLRKEDPVGIYFYIVAAPKASFKDEIRAEGYTIVQKLDVAQLIATADHHEKQEHPSTPNPVSTP